jgi:hypothetical protein
MGTERTVKFFYTIASYLVLLTNIRLIKSRRSRWERHATCIEDKTTACKMLVKKLRGRHSMQDLGIAGRNIEMDLKEIMCIDIAWIHLRVGSSRGLLLSRTRNCQNFDHLCLLVLRQIVLDRRSSFCIRSPPSVSFNGAHTYDDSEVSVWYLCISC